MPCPLVNCWSTVTRLPHKSSASVSFTHLLALSQAGTRLLLLASGWFDDRGFGDWIDLFTSRLVKFETLLCMKIVSFIKDFGGSIGILAQITTLSFAKWGCSDTKVRPRDSSKFSVNETGFESRFSDSCLVKGRLPEGSPFAEWISIIQLVRIAKLAC